MEKQGKEGYASASGYQINVALLSPIPLTGRLAGGPDILSLPIYDKDQSSIPILFTSSTISN